MKNLIEKINNTPIYPYGIRVDFMDKATQWIDPVNEINLTNNKLNINNGAVGYQFNLTTIKDILYYPVCEHCGHELILYENETCLRCGV